MVASACAGCVNVKMSNGSAGAMAYVSLDMFVVPPGGKYPIFFAGIFVYLFCVLCNVTLLAAIVLRRNLHKPVYFILLSLPLNDLMGITAMLPKVLSGIVAESNRMPYPLCVLQAFLLHLYGGGILFILAAMAFDRYVAICMPLRYGAVMTPRVVAGVVTLVWTLDLVLITALFSLQTGLRRCRSDVANVFCDNPSLLKLMCGDTSVNNIVGLVNTAVMQAISVSVQAFSYIKILIACVATRRTEPKKKAVNTCVAQLVILIIFEIVGTFTILSHRFQNVSADLQKAMGVLIFLISPLLNPLVYGLFVFLLLEGLGLFTIISYRVKHLPPSFRGFMGSSTLIFPPSLNPIVKMMSSNGTRFPNFFLMGFPGLVPRYHGAVSALLLLVFLVIAGGNIFILLLIKLDRRLHKPTFLIFCHLALTDLLFGTVTLPRVIWR